MTKMPPNVAHLVCTDEEGQPIPPDVAELSALHFDFDVVPFIVLMLFNGWLKRSQLHNDPTFGLSFEDDPILHHAFV